ncbi:MAG: T9SS type A sorting domain-containing protein, partial [Bacteroidota bacterium]
NLSGKVAYYRNIGSGPKAEFEWVTDDFNALSGLGLLALHLTFGDLDGDGDQDMLIGESGGQLVFMRNTSLPGAASAFVLDMAAYQGIDVGDNAAPQLIDVDRDGLLDLVIGERAGNVNYFRNTGSGSNPVFTLVTSQFGSVNVTAPGSFTGFSVPRLIDRAGSYEMIVGSQDGFIHHYDSIDANLNGAFRLRDSVFQGIAEPTYASPDFSDVDGDTKPDLFVGVFSGGISLYTQNTSLSLQATSEALNMLVYPNPANQRLNVIWSELASGSDPLLRVFDLAGRLVKVANGYHSPHSLDISDLPPGAYVLQVQSDLRTGRATFIKY